MHNDMLKIEWKVAQAIKKGDHSQYVTQNLYMFKQKLHAHLMSNLTNTWPLDIDPIS